MALVLQHVQYADLTPRQRTTFDFQKVSAVLANYGYVTTRLTGDEQNADFSAQHLDGAAALLVKIRGRLWFKKAYADKNLYVTFFEDGYWYLFPHDELLGVVLAETNIANTASWIERGSYSFPSLSVQLQQLLLPYRLIGDLQPVSADAS